MDRRKIMIVDDDRDIRMGLNVRLRSSGYDTVFAEDGVGAISVARKERPDVILLDIGLPAGDGFVVLERLATNPDLACIPVIVLSAKDPATNEPKAIEKGATAYFQKPADNEALLDAIAKYL